MNNAKNIILTVLTVLVLGLAGWASWLVYNAKPASAPEQKPVPTTSSITDFTSCAAAGNPVTQSSPRTCTNNGVTYTEKTPVEQPRTMDFTSQKGVTVRLNDWTTNKTLSSPATITGEIPGNWSFEASFPVVLMTNNGTVLAQQAAHLEGDWMTSNNVPFTVTLPFAHSPSDTTGFLILQKDNPSGMPQNDDAIRIPVTLK